jgi:hypothetical protein
MVTEAEPKSATTVRLLNERIVQCNRGVRLVDLAKHPKITLSYSGAAYSEVSTHPHTHGDGRHQCYDEATYW